MKYSERTLQRRNRTIANPDRRKLRIFSINKLSENKIKWLLTLHHHFGDDYERIQELTEELFYP